MVLLATILDCLERAICQYNTTTVEYYRYTFCFPATRGQQFGLCSTHNETRQCNDTPKPEESAKQHITILLSYLVKRSQFIRRHLRNNDKTEVGVPVSWGMT